MTYDYRSVTAASVAAETDAALASAEEQIARAVASAGAPSVADTLAPIELANAAVGTGYGRGAFMAQVATPIRGPRRRERRRGAANEMARGARLPRRPVRRGACPRRLPAGAALEGEDRRLLDFWLRDFRRAGQELEHREASGARSHALTPRRARGRLPAQHLRVLRRNRGHRARSSPACRTTYIERLEPGEQPGTHARQPRLPRIHALPGAGARSPRCARRCFARTGTRPSTRTAPLLAEAIQRCAGRWRRCWAIRPGRTTPWRSRMAGGPERVDGVLRGARAAPPGRRAARDRRAGDVAGCRRGRRRRSRPGTGRTTTRSSSSSSTASTRTRSAEYLPLDGVWQGMFEITGEVFGLDYREVEDAKTWHPSRAALRDPRSREWRAAGPLLCRPLPARGQVRPRGRLPARHRASRADGSYATPVNAIVANFTPPAGDRPSLLRHGQHGEVETLFHEFGHILHMSLTRAELRALQRRRDRVRLRRGAVADHGALGLAARG